MMVFINNKIGRKLVDAELISENRRTCWVKVPCLKQTDFGSYFRWSSKIIKRKKSRDLPKEEWVS